MIMIDRNKLKAAARFAATDPAKDDRAKLKRPDTARRTGRSQPGGRAPGGHRRARAAGGAGGGGH
jgi:hypothetical protein